MTIGTTSFPTSLDTATELFRTVNDAASVIGVGGATSGATTIPVADTSRAPADGAAVITNASGTIKEIIYFTGKTASSVTGCTRGADGSSPQAWAQGDLIYFDAVPAAYHRVHNDAIIATQTKLGSGATTPASNTFLKGSGTGTSAWTAWNATEITTTLGYTPVNKAGDTMSGDLYIQKAGASAYPSEIIQSFDPTDAWGAPWFLFRRSRGATTSAYTAVQTGDLLGGIEWWGADGTDWAIGASIYGIVSGTPGNNDMPTSLLFYTTPEGSDVQLERLRLDSTGCLIHQLGYPFAIDGYMYSADSAGYRIRAYKSRNATIGSHTIVQQGDIMLDIFGGGSDGSTWRDGALIRMHVDGTPGASDMPGAISFFTTPDGSTTLAERMRIKSDGNVTFYNDIFVDSPTAWGPLGLDGNTQGGTLDFYKAGVYQGSLYTNTGGNIVICDATSDRFKIDTSGGVTILGLAGTGTRGVDVDSTGKFVVGDLAGMVLIDTWTFSGVSSTTRDGVFSSTYENYLLVISNYSSGSNTNTYLRFRASASEATGSDYYYAYDGADSTAVAYGPTGATATANGILISDHGGAPQNMHITAFIHQPQVADYTTVRCDWEGRWTTGAMSGWGGGIHNLQTAYDGLALRQTTGTFSGTAHVYGLRN